jgi:predicted Zn-dependent protease
MISALRLVCVLALALLPGACANLNMYSDQQLEPLSAQAYEESTKETGGVITSGKDYEMVQRVAKKIATASGENFNWQVRLLKADDTMNAFCLPNGRIAVYTGILKVTQNEDALAVVLGHEVAHAVLRHGGKRMTSDTLSQGAMAAIDAGLGLAQMSPEHRSTTMAALGVVSNVGVALPYSRGYESEADVEGLRYAIRAGYNPEEAPKLWERMEKLSGSSGPAWLSTHPASADRAAKLREMIPVLKEQEKNWKPKPMAPAPQPASAQQPAKNVAPNATKK